MKPLLREDMAVLIDQTLLKPTVGFAGGVEWIDSNRDAGFSTLCVSPFLVAAAAERLAGTCTDVCSVVGFPLGTETTETKAEDAVRLVDLGCVEIDMVLNVGALLEGEDALVAEDIGAVVASVREGSGGRGLVKVILETGYLDEPLILKGCGLAVEAGADYVKTSTGFGPRGASVEDVRIMREAVGQSVGVKAAGGIRDAEAAHAMVEAGASRIGTSSGPAILAALEVSRD
jgi:deoxyribose-phosphate aldolase